MARALNRAVARVAPPGQSALPVEREYLVRAAEMARAGWALPAPLPAAPGEPLVVAWIFEPPSKGSGGHTTMFRLVSALEQAGHQCVLYLYDRHGWALSQHERTIRRWWPSVKAEVRDLRDGLDDSHAAFATSWETAYLLLGERAKGARFYLVQDFEPWFYPAGSDALLAEATYRFGFRGVTAGRWLAAKLTSEYGMVADAFPFGRDPDYSLDAGAPDEQRRDVCFYARPKTPRRAYELGVAALDLLAEMHPGVDIHFFGQDVKPVPFAARYHGVVPPSQLNTLYNRCVAGLVLSATNVSLVPHEMLAAGCIPVVNDAEHNRIVLENDEIAYAPATPFELANAIGALLDSGPSARAARARSAAASVQGASWDLAGETVERVVRDAVLQKLPLGVAS